MVGAKLLYYIPESIFYGSGDRGVKEWVQIMLLGQNSSSQKERVPVKLVQNS